MKSFKRWLIRVGLLFAASLGLAMVQAPSAAAVRGIGISPTNQELTVNAGEKLSGELTVLNDGDTDVIYKLYATDYRVSGEDYAGDFTNDASKANVSAVSWFSLPSTNATIKPRQQVKVPYTLTIPANASVGGHYAAVFVETVPPKNTSGSVINRVDRLASIFYIAVDGNLNQVGSIAELNVPRMQSLPPITGTLRVKNEGNVHFNADVTFTLESPFGKIGQPHNVKGEVLPGTTRRFAISLPPGSAIGLYKVTASVKYLDRTDSVSKWTLLVPRLTFMIVAGSLLLVGVVLAWGLVRRFRRSRRRR